MDAERIEQLEKSKAGVPKTGSKTQENTKVEGDTFWDKVIEQANGIEKAQEKAGKNAPKGQKQNKINSTKGSKQDMKNTLNKTDWFGIEKNPQ